jgi:hypothetical protein
MNSIYATISHFIELYDIQFMQIDVDVCTFSVVVDHRSTHYGIYMFLLSI